MRIAVLFVSLVFSLSADGLPIRQVELSTLLNPETRHLEVGRLGKEDWDEPTEEQRKHFVQRAAVVECPQRDGEASFYLLAEDSFGKGWPFGEEEADTFSQWVSYPQEQVAETFPERFLVGVVNRWSKPDERGLQKSLGVRLEKQVIHFFDGSGKELRPFGGGNMISDGFLVDVNGDGVLEIVDYGYCLSGDEKFRVVEVKTVERESKALLQVVFGDKGFTGDALSCADEDGDGFFEVSIREEDGGKIIYQWDDEKKGFTGPKGGPGKSFVRLGIGEFWPQLKKLADAGGLVDKSAVAEKVAERREREVKGLVVQQAREAGWDWVWDMMAPGVSAFLAEIESHTETQLPEGFSKMDAAAAALAFVDGSRSEEHRRKVKLGIWKGGEEKPERGWMVFDSSSSGCYVMATRLTAISFGVPDPKLVVIDYSSNGVVGRNLYLDTAGYDLRVIPLKNEESDWITDFLWSLNRIRSLESGDVPDYSSVSSSADGGGSFYLCGKKNRYFEFGTLWATGRLASRWATGYQPETCLNFVDWYLMNGLQEQFGARWQESDLVHHSLATSDDERRKERHSREQRQDLLNRIKEVLSLHEIEPLPFDLLASMTKCAAEVGLFELQEEMEKLSASLPEKGAMEKRIVGMMNRPIDLKLPENPFGPEAEIEEGDDDYEVSLRRVFYPIGLRTELEAFFKRSEIVGDAEALVTMSREENYGRFWAMRQLRKHYAEKYGMILQERFEKAENFQEKWALMNSLVAEVPEIALKVIDQLDAKTRRILSPVFATLVLERRPDERGRLRKDLLELAQDTTQPWEWRYPAIATLVPERNGFLIGEADLDDVLLKVAAKEKSEVDEYVPLAVSTSALSALARRGESEEGWKLVLSRLRAGKDEGLTSLINIAGHYASHQVEWQRELEKYFNERLGHNQARLGDVLEVALVFDFRLLEEKAISLATAGPTAAESESANTVLGKMRASKNERFHRARQAAVYWGQKSAEDRFVALASWALQEPWSFRGDEEDKATLAFLLSKVTGEAGAEVVEKFLQWAEERQEETSGDIVKLIKSSL